MDFYKRHDVNIRSCDVEKVDSILSDPEIDSLIDTRYFSRVSDTITTCWIAPYISDDLELIKETIRKNGIQII